MELKTETVVELLRKRAERLDYQGVDYADNYGGRESDSNVGMVLVVDGWDTLTKLGLTRKGDGERTYGTRFADLAETAGVETVFSDEYTVDSSESLAWRMSASSYDWTPQAFYGDSGELVTVDDERATIVHARAWDESAVELRNGAVFFALGRSFAHALQGDDEPRFIRWPGRELESGWHPGQDDDPVAGAERIARIYPNVGTVVALYEPSQFYTAWRYYVSATDVRR